MRKLYYFDSDKLAADFTALCKRYRISASSVVQRLCFLYVTGDSCIQQRVTDLSVTRSMAELYPPTRPQDVY